MKYIIMLVLGSFVVLYMYAIVPSILLIGSVAAFKNEWGPISIGIMCLADLIAVMFCPYFVAILIIIMSVGLFLGLMCTNPCPEE